MRTPRLRSGAPNHVFIRAIVVSFRTIGPARLGLMRSFRCAAAGMATARIRKAGRTALSRVFMRAIVSRPREDAQSLRELLSFTKKKEEDPLMQYLIEFRDRIAHAKELLTDPEKTAFFFVTLPEALPIAVIRRFINWFTDFGIPVGGVVVNQVIEVDDQGGAHEFVKNRMAMQAGHMEKIREEFEGMVRAMVPLYEDEIRGIPSLEQASGVLIG